jgi:hypothetical protein
MCLHCCVAGVTDPGPAEFHRGHDLTSSASAPAALRYSKCVGNFTARGTSSGVTLQYLTTPVPGKTTWRVRY